MLNHFNFRKFENEVLLTNDFGKHVFLPINTFREFVGRRLLPETDEYRKLRDNGFIIDQPFEVFADTYCPELRSMKSYLFSSTALHIFAVTNACNLNCVYCQAKDVKSVLSGMMTYETGRKAVELAMQSPNQDLTFEFQGGEPLLNFDVIREMIRYSKELNKDLGKRIQYTIVSNLIALTDEHIEFLREENVSICTSLDGCQAVHDSNRPFKSDGHGSYDTVMARIRYLKQLGMNVSAIVTTTRKSLEYPIELVDTYRSAGIHSLFIRPMTPLGFAKAYWEQIGYTAEEYLEYYRKVFEYILQINLSGEFFPELQAVYFLKKIMAGYADNYMELRSPCGAGVGQLSYYYDGNVYTCDEGRMLSEMGDKAFLLGNVQESSYSDLMDHQTCKALCASSVVEALPHCCDCVYQPYCGVCPVVTYAGEHDIFARQPFDFRCKVYSGILDLLFSKIHSGDERILDIFSRWTEA